MHRSIPLPPREMEDPADALQGPANATLLRPPSANESCLMTFLFRVTVWLPSLPIIQPRAYYRGLLLLLFPLLVRHGWYSIFFLPTVSFVVGC